jgi:hypothetical protein
MSLRVHSSEIGTAINTALAMYSFEADVAVKAVETGYTAELVLGHVTDHLMDEIRRHIKFMTGLKVKGWDMFSVSETELHLVLRISRD